MEIMQLNQNTTKKSATRKKCNMKEVQPEKNAT